MSSEDKTVEPSDQGPSLPSGTAGATSTGSPAQTDKRPRGRPRKDAAAVSPLAPQAPPTSKTRKKGHTRGRAFVVEEEEAEEEEEEEEEDSSMDGTEAAASEVPPQDTADMPAQQPVDCLEENAQGPGEGEEKPLSPYVQSPKAGDAGEPSAPDPVTIRGAKSSEQLCAFCYCGGRSLLGQGDLQVFESSHGREVKGTGGGAQTRDQSEASDDSSGDTSSPLPSKAAAAGDAGSGQRATQNGCESHGELADPDSTSRFWDDLAHVGLPGDIDVQSLFEDSGRCWAHHRCALWSQGVCPGQGQSLLNVDRAIDSGSTEHCAYCKRLGASIKCCAEGCARLYHYPCAGAAGTFQDIRSLSLLCPDHTELAIQRFPDDSICALCDSPGELHDQLFCTSCGQHYHGACLDMAVTPLRRAGWQCPECKVCQTCKNPGEDDKMLVCDVCDKGYHTFCLQPAIDDIPTNGWRCKNCRVCVQCGTRTIGQGHHTSLLCEGCVQHQDPTHSCLLCACILDPEHHKDLLSCRSCKRWLHLECERQSSGKADTQLSQDYVCSSCRPTGSQPQQAILQAEDEEDEEEEMDTGGLEPSPQSASQMHTDSNSVVLMHTDPEPVPKQLRSPSPMHKDPEPELPPIPMHTDIEPELQAEPVQASTSVCDSTHEDTQPHQAVSDQQIGVLVGPAVAAEEEERVTGEVSVKKALSHLQPAGETQVPSTESPESPKVTELEKSQPALKSMELDQPLDVTPGLTILTNTEPSSEKSMIKHSPSTEDIQAITPPTTKEPSSTSVSIKEEPVEVSASEPSGVKQAQVTSNLPTAAEDALREQEDLHMPGILAGGVLVGACALEAMDTTPEAESKPCLSHVSPPSEEKPYKTSMERLAEMAASPTHSPPRTKGPSPREPLQPHNSHPTLGEYSSSLPSTTLIPLTPKIGMGKPAISKRKFSPGRPRVKQGAWHGSPHSSVSSPSWSPDQPEGWDVQKSRQLTSGWSIRVGRGSGFPGRRRPRGAGLSGRGGRGRARGKNGVSPTINPGVTTMESVYQVKEEEENAMHNTVVIFSSNDSFTLKQDMCVVCGSFGLGAEGRLLACAQCGQCYHPFCVGIKVHPVTLLLAVGLLTTVDTGTYRCATVSDN